MKMPIYDPKDTPEDRDLDDQIRSDQADDLRDRFHHWDAEDSAGDRARAKQQQDEDSGRGDQIHDERRDARDEIRHMQETSERLREMQEEFERSMVNAPPTLLEHFDRATRDPQEAIPMECLFTVKEERNVVIPSNGIMDVLTDALRAGTVEGRDAPDGLPQLILHHAIMEGGYLSSLVVMFRVGLSDRHYDIYTVTYCKEPLKNGEFPPVILGQMIETARRAWERRDPNPPRVRSKLECRLWDALAEAVGSRDINELKGMAAVILNTKEGTREDREAVLAMIQTLLDCAQ